MKKIEEKINLITEELKKVETYENQQMFINEMKRYKILPRPKG